MQRTSQSYFLKYPSFTKLNTQNIAIAIARKQIILITKMSIKGKEFLTAINNLFYFCQLFY